MNEIIISLNITIEMHPCFLPLKKRENNIICTTINKMHNSTKLYTIVLNFFFKTIDPSLK